MAAYGLIVVLAGIVLFGSLLLGGMSELAEALPYLAVATASSGVVVWQAAASIARAWAEGDDQPVSPPLSGRPNGSW